MPPANITGAGAANVTGEADSSSGLTSQQFGGPAVSAARPRTPPAHIAAAFSGAVQHYSVGELGAGHGTGGIDTETSTAQFILEIAATKVSAGGHLVVDLFGDKTSCNGVTAVSLSVSEKGTAVSALF